MAIVLSESPSEAELGRVLALLRPGGEVRFEREEDEGRLVLAGFVETSGRRARRPEWEDGAGEVWGGGGGGLVDEAALLGSVAAVEPGWGGPGAAGEGECGPAKKACKNCVCGRAEAEAGGAAGEAKKTLAESGAASVDPATGKTVVDTAKLKAAAGGCGSCALGDAFRCKGCPSKGLPSYTVGEKIILDLE